MRSRIAVTSVLLLVTTIPLSGQVNAHKTAQGDHPLDNRRDQTAATVDVCGGTVVLDGHGEAWVSVPACLGPQDRDFSYQLTAIGAPAPNLYIAQKIADNRFKIAGGNAGMEVSWHVTGVRGPDTRAAANSTRIEHEKRPAVAAFDQPVATSGGLNLRRHVASPKVLAHPAATIPVTLTAEDIAAIKDILERQFKDAFESRSMSEMQKVWPDMPRVARNDIAALFHSSDVQDMRIELKCSPVVAADRVLAYCSHSFFFSVDRKAQTPMQFSVVYRLSHSGQEWHLEESRPSSATGLSD